MKQQSHWNLEKSEKYLIENFNVSYKTKSSYYNLLHEAGLSWQKAQVVHPQKDPEKVALKKEIGQYLGTHRSRIESGQTVVYFLDVGVASRRD